MSSDSSKRGVFFSNTTPVDFKKRGVFFLKETPCFSRKGVYFLWVYGLVDMSLVGGDSAPLC